MNRLKILKEIISEGRDAFLDMMVEPLAWLIVTFLGTIIIIGCLYTIFSVFYTSIDLIF